MENSTGYNITFNYSTTASPKDNFDLAETLVYIYRAYVSPAIVVLGLIGNILVVVIFLSEKRKTRFTIYSIFLAFTDTTALIVNSFMDDFLGRGLLYLTNESIKFDTISTIMCKFMEYIPNVAYFGSSYLLICFSLDRVLTIYNPVKYYSEHYIRSAVIACTVTLSISICVNLPMLIGNQLVQNSSHGHGKHKAKCETPGNDNVSKFALYLKVIVVFSLSTMIILIINGIIIVKLFNIRRARQRLLSNPKENRMEMGRVVGHLVLSTLFFFLNLPLVILMLIRLQDKTRNPTYVHLSRLFSSVKDINYAVNFYLYCMFLSMFRWRFLALLCGSCIENAWFSKVPGHGRLHDGILRFERLQEPYRKRSTVAALAQHVNHNLGVRNSSIDRQSCGRHNHRDRSCSLEVSTELSVAHNTHL